MEEKRNWGGKRNGSGRKKKANSTIISIKINDDLLDAFPVEIKGPNDKMVKFNRSQYINDALRLKMIADGYLSESNK